MQLVAPRAVSTAEIIEARICSDHLSVSFLVIVHLPSILQFFNSSILHLVAEIEATAFAALSEGLACYSRSLTVEDGNGLDGRSSAQRDRLAVEGALC